MAYTEARYVIFFTFFASLVVYFVIMADLSPYVETTSAFKQQQHDFLQPIPLNTPLDIFTFPFSFAGKVMNLLTFGVFQPELLIFNLFVLAMIFAFVLVLIVSLVDVVGLLKPF